MFVCVAGRAHDSLKACSLLFRDPNYGMILGAFDRVPSSGATPQAACATSFGYIDRRNNSFRKCSEEGKLEGAMPCIIVYWSET